ncbi:hypothetical protein HK099_005899 [Clydaea vesicula]|uniref:Uncharacterized protein n=1 Tax=Clydaea vesicula TaxID=447962 RepID=A0AAD5TYR1_9FUNG|nr:hypothetical protein HK099_005899 [Clydaea vesicula]
MANYDSINLTSKSILHNNHSTVIIGSHSKLLDDDDEFDQHSDETLRLIKSQFSTRKNNKNKFFYIRKFLTYALCILLLISIFSFLFKQNNTVKDKIVMLISIDSFTPRYLNFNVTPTISSLAANGVRAKFMEPVYPSSTFPNHFSLVTGLYPESHGIIANVFYDTSDNSVFTYTNPLDANNSKWWLGEPIWITAEKNNVRSATCMWPGSEAEIQGFRPSIYEKFSYMDLHTKIDKIFSWLDLPDFPRLITLYIPEVDSAGHTSGPESQLVKDNLALVDKEINYLLDGLKYRGIRENVDLIIVSDHGMTDTTGNYLTYCLEGQHGFNPEMPDMHAMFIANGPSFPKNVVLEGFKNLEIYEMLCNILSIPAAPNNSTAFFSTSKILQNT